MYHIRVHYMPYNARNKGNGLLGEAFFVNGEFGVEIREGLVDSQHAVVQFFTVQPSSEIEEKLQQINGSIEAQRRDNPIHDSYPRGNFLIQDDMTLPPEK